MSNQGINPIIRDVDFAFIQTSVTKDILFDSCQQKCIGNIKSGTLDTGEQVCVDRCTKKFFEVYKLVAQIMEESAKK